jgi:hypothetical protein
LKVLTVLINGQKPYGKEYSVSDTFLYYKMKLDGKYTAEQIMKAVDIYTDKKNDVPAPADIIQILNPPEKQITYAEYKHALEQHAAEGYPMFGYFGGVIKDYQKQQAAESGIKTRQEISDGRQPEELSQKVKAILAVTYGGQNGKS